MRVSPIIKKQREQSRIAHEIWLFYKRLNAEKQAQYKLFFIHDLRKLVEYVYRKRNNTTIAEAFQAMLGYELTGHANPFIERMIGVSTWYILEHNGWPAYMFDQLAYTIEDHIHETLEQGKPLSPAVASLVQAYVPQYGVDLACFSALLTADLNATAYNKAKANQ